ncbi:MAG: hypothetical protein WBG92_02305 [Thiohalocapsa sp.]
MQVPPEVYEGFYPGAHEMREMFQYFAECSYFGPEHAKHIAAANALVPGGFTDFANWARVHMKPTPGGSEAINPAAAVSTGQSVPATTAQDEVQPEVQETQ